MKSILLLLFLDILLIVFFRFCFVSRERPLFYVENTARCFFSFIFSCVKLLQSFFGLLLRDCETSRSALRFVRVSFASGAVPDPGKNFDFSLKLYFQGMLYFFSRCGIDNHTVWFADPLTTIDRHDTAELKIPGSQVPQPYQGNIFHVARNYVRKKILDFTGPPTRRYVRHLLC